MNCNCLRRKPNSIITVLMLLLVSNLMQHNYSPEAIASIKFNVTGGGGGGVKVGE